ncbi:MAG: glycine/sarcosine/betaine reductase selenoprotein B family protein [Proteobacteria bacterium]|nr:glycine/sarcosine/betaine reductase selenoprotein B family protein [Pseudomonadota bacterium]
MMSIEQNINDPDAPLPYLERIRTYYQALGYGEPYQWAHFDDVPFSPLPKPLANSRIALLTTAAPFQTGKGDQGPGAAYNGAAKFYTVYSLPTDSEPDLRISHIAYDRDHTTAEDQNSWFPLPHMKQLAAIGEIGELPPRFHGIPTNRSHRTTQEQDCPAVLARLREDGVDAAVIVPNCPVCHQTAALTARYLEANDIPTVIMGCAKDIVEHVGVPRLLFSDFPLGNSAGKPHDPESQALTLRLALELLVSATAPRTTVQSPLKWSDDPAWKLDYSNVDRLSPEEIARRRREFDEQKAAAKIQKAIGEPSE